MTARFTLGLVLVVLQFTLYAAGMLQTAWLLVVSVGYFASTLTTGLFGTPRRLGSTFNRPWVGLVGVDVLAFSVLQFLPGASINYTPLFVLPILLASVLGSLQLALGTAAGVTVLLLGGTLWTQLARDTDTAPYLVQSALSGVGYFAIALLANQLSSRLASEGLRARRSLAAANVQRQVNTLVIESHARRGADRGPSRWRAGHQPRRRAASGCARATARRAAGPHAASGLGALAGLDPAQPGQRPGARARRGDRV